MQGSNVKIIDYAKKANEFEQFHKTGGVGMNYAGFECLENVFKFALDGITDITGTPASGKTEFALELLFYQTEAYGLRHLIYAPDIGSYNEIRRKLLVKHYRRSFRGHENSITQSEIIQATAFIDTYFLIAGKEDVKKPLTPIDLWNFTADYEDKNGIINTCFIDSWKNLSHEYGGREDTYLDYVLSYRNELAETKQRHFMTIAHPKNVEIQMPKDGSKPKRRVPDANDISGGASWYRNGKVIITVDRPDKERDYCDVYFSKVKPDTLGRQKTLFGDFEFDWRKSRYRETVESRMYYAGEAKKAKERGEFIGFASVTSEQNEIFKAQTNYIEPPFNPAPF